jgi:hypothetical protein
VLDNVRGKDIPIVHRVVRTYPEVEGRVNAKKVKEITVYGFSFLRYTLLLIADLGIRRLILTCSSPRYVSRGTGIQVH